MSARSDAINVRLKMTGQNVRLANPLIGEKAIGSLGVGPILANQRDALPHGAPDLGQQLRNPEPLAKPRVAKLASGGFSINPTVGARVVSRSRNIKPMEHPSIANQVLSNESQAILSTQHFAVVAAPHGVRFVGN
jgi:hypothetical protein